VLLALLGFTTGVGPFHDKLIGLVFGSTLLKATEYEHMCVINTLKM
jgi:hypothetical protein